MLVYVLPESARWQAIADLTTCLETDVLRHLVGQHFPLAELAAAHEAVECGSTSGKVVEGGSGRDKGRGMTQSEQCIKGTCSRRSIALYAGGESEDGKRASETITEFCRCTAGHEHTEGT